MAWVFGLLGFVVPAYVIQKLVRVSFAFVLQHVAVPSGGMSDCPHDISNSLMLLSIQLIPDLTSEKKYHSNEVMFMYLTITAGQFIVPLDPCFLRVPLE